MLEADEVDIDYFTPVASTTLANIFGSDTRVEEKDDVSLKYVPIPPQNSAPKQEESKATQIIYASTFFGYEWVNNTYASRGKLGAAIVKSVKTEHYNIILYDCNKLTLSCTNISPELEINIKGNSNLSYYDNYKNYWSLYGTDVEISKFIEKLKPFNIQINKLLQTESGPENITTKKHDDNIVSSQILKDEESDTNSSIKIRTKDSILKRMATMGQSVLPMQAVTLPRSDESSDTDETSQKIIRHKFQKINSKRNFNKKVDLNKDSSTEVNLEKRASNLYSDNISANNFDQQLVPTCTNIITNPIINNSNDLNLFMSEQRISNSELRININRLADKMDKVLEGIQSIGETESNSNTINFQSDIIQKLLNEYENKIKTYENYLVSKGLNYVTILKSYRQHGEDNNMQNDIDSHKNKIEELEKIIDEKDIENAFLQNELKTLQAKFESYNKASDKKQEEQFKEINLLKEELCSKNKQLATLSEDLKSLSLQNSNDFRRKVKSIMNKTFHSLSANFADSESYPGAAIKSLFASVIKKVTMEALNEV
ncbi:unnamed protein product [Parnassius apollo]|uniref:(apollo) hypothetical protein n=1 Tax=Parnassius apollo TaxID=110799 RepID=A0A8S3XDK0_PARAO|nr:unnamed protein product [Parnassius apollo]